MATIPALDDVPIEDYGYKLVRAWGVGQKGKNTGAILIVAPADHKVRIEVGYGLEPVLTDALSDVIIQEKILPAFRQGDIAAGVTAGIDAIIAQLSASTRSCARDGGAGDRRARPRPPPLVGWPRCVLLAGDRRRLADRLGAAAWRRQHRRRAAIGDRLGDLVGRRVEHDEPRRRRRRLG